MPSPTSPSFTVVTSRAVQNAFRSLGQQASKAGIEKDVLAAVRVILDRLKADPLGFGEPTHQLYHMGLEVRLGVVSPLAVRFAVLPGRQIVFVTEFTLLSSGGS